MLFIVLSFFSVIIFANSMLISSALKSFPGEDVKGSYRQGLAYNETLHARARQRALHWSADIFLSKNNKITLNIVDENKQIVRGLDVVGLLKHPTDTDFDIELTFQQDIETGLYTSYLENRFMGKRRLHTKAYYSNIPTNTLTGKPRGAPVFETQNELWLK